MSSKSDPNGIGIDSSVEPMGFITEIESQSTSGSTGTLVNQSHSGILSSSIPSVCNFSCPYFSHVLCFCLYSVCIIIHPLFIVHNLLEDSNTCYRYLYLKTKWIDNYVHGDKTTIIKWCHWWHEDAHPTILLEQIMYNLARSCKLCACGQI